MVHNLRIRPSEVAVIDKFSGVSLRRFRNVGTSAHGLAFWRDSLIVLDSDGGQIVAITRSSEAQRQVWQCQEACFLKGLAVVKDVAYAGVAPPQMRLQRLFVNCALVAVDLRSGEELYFQHIETLGLLNLIGHPLYVARYPEQDVEQIPIRKNRPLGQARETSSTNGLSRPLVRRYVPVGSVDITSVREDIIANWDKLWSGYDHTHLFPGLRGASFIFQVL